MVLPRGVAFKLRAMKQPHSLAIPFLLREREIERERHNGSSSSRGLLHVHGVRAAYFSPSFLSPLFFVFEIDGSWIPCIQAPQCWLLTLFSGAVGSLEACKWLSFRRNGQVVVLSRHSFSLRYLHLACWFQIVGFLVYIQVSVYKLKASLHKGLVDGRACSFGCSCRLLLISR